MKNINGNIKVEGKRWFQKTYGNTYHSVQVVVNDEILVDNFEYGYESAYRQTAHKLLLKNNFNVPENYSDFIQLENVDFNVNDVERKKDLQF